MFLPFLPLILASASLTILSGELERPDPWLNLPLIVTLPLIILFGFFLAQMTQRCFISKISKTEQNYGIGGP